MDAALRAYGMSWAAAEPDLKKWLTTRDAHDFARWQASLADVLRNLMPVEDAFARERIVMLSLQRVRASLLTVDQVSPATALDNAKQAWSKEAFRVRTLMGDAEQQVAREQAFADLEGLTWTWRTKLDERTCPYCVAMHGTVHPMGTPMLSHPNCRCMPVSEGLGSGWAWLRAQTVETQDTILGRSVAIAYRAGRLGPENIIDYAKRRRFPLRTIFGVAFKRRMTKARNARRMRVTAKRRARR